jgi:hypothetical protein
MPLSAGLRIEPTSIPQIQGTGMALAYRFDTGLHGFISNQPEISKGFTRTVEKKRSRNGWWIDTTPLSRKSQQPVLEDRVVAPDFGVLMRSSMAPATDSATANLAMPSDCLDPEN